MPIFPTHDPDLVNRIANSEAVRPYIRPDGGVMDWAPLVTRPITETGVVVLTDGVDALAAFEITAPGVYQSHTLFGQACRGRKAIDTAKAMVAWMFNHGASIVWGTTPRENRAARWFNRQIGARVLATSDETDEVFEIRKAA